MILYADKPGLSIGKKSETIVISQRGEKPKSVSIRDLEGVIIRSKAHLSYDAIILLSKYSVPVIYHRGREIVANISPFANHGFVLTRRAQLNAYNMIKGLEIGKSIVIGGLENKMRLLKYYSKNKSPKRRDFTDNLDPIIAGIKSNIFKVKNLKMKESNVNSMGLGDRTPIEGIRERIMGYEGEGAHLYFKAMTRLVPKEFEFSGRNRRPPRDPLNAGLSYGYTILQGEIMSAIAICGLEPYAGFLHSDRSGKPSLVLDLIEEFRQPIIDRILLRLVNLGMLKPSHFEEKGPFLMLSKEGKSLYIDSIQQELKGKRQSVDGRSLTYRQVILHQARKFVRYLLDREDTYEPFKFNW